MENRRVLKSNIKTHRLYALMLIIVFAFITPFIAFSYEISTHKNLHQNIIDEYQRITGKTLTKEEIEAFLEGAKLEDNTPRYMNHFYDPINKKGLSNYYNSIQWANNPVNQKILKHTGKLFDGKYEYTFPRAVYEYVHGDKQKAMRALGQVMHLLEDLTSVPHTRNDPHPINSPYENYTANLKPNITLNDVDKNNINKTNSLEELFHQTALYTNTNFLSKDTVFTKYDKPKKDYNNVKLLQSDSSYQEGFLLNERGDLLIKFVLRKDTKSGKYIEVLTFEHPIVLNAYWNTLSRKAVESGVSLLDLFFREVEKEKRTNHLKEANISFNEAMVLKRLESYPKIAFSYKNQKQTITNPIYNPNSTNEVCKQKDECVFRLTPNTSYKIQKAILANKFYKVIDSTTQEKITKLINQYTNWTIPIAIAHNNSYQISTPEKGNITVTPNKSEVIISILNHQQEKESETNVSKENLNTNNNQTQQQANTEESKLPINNKSTQQRSDITSPEQLKDFLSNLARLEYQLNTLLKQLQNQLDTFKQPCFGRYNPGFRIFSCADNPFDPGGLAFGAGGSSNSTENSQANNGNDDCSTGLYYPLDMYIEKIVSGGAYLIGENFVCVPEDYFESIDEDESWDAEGWDDEWDDISSNTN